MLKKPYVSRGFGHLFDLVRTVMRCALHRISLVTRQTSICIIPSLTKRDSTATRTTRITAAAADKNINGSTKALPYLSVFIRCGRGISSLLHDKRGLFLKSPLLKISPKLEKRGKGCRVYKIVKICKNRKNKKF